MKLSSEETAILNINKIYLSVLGLWPQAPNNILFYVSFFYYAYCLVLTYLSFYFALGNLRKTIRSITEVITFSQILYRMFIIKQYNRQFNELFKDIGNQFMAKSQRTKQENQAISVYYQICRIFSKTLVIFLGITAFMYFTKPILRQISQIFLNPGKTNIVLKYDLPQGFYSLYEVNSLLKYVLTYLFQLPFVLISNFGQGAMDCLILVLVCYLCGQLFILSSRIKQLNSKTKHNRSTLYYYIKIHQHLLGLGTQIQNCFRSCLLVHLIGASILICILVYNVLANIAQGQMTTLLTFFFYGSLNIWRLYAYCCVGDFLILESTKIYKAFFECNWFNFSLTEKKLIIFVINRAQKPLFLMAGRFGSISLTTFAEVMKTALAYLSVLRSVG